MGGPLLLWVLESAADVRGDEVEDENRTDDKPRRVFAVVFLRPSQDQSPVRVVGARRQALERRAEPRRLRRGVLGAAGLQALGLASESQVSL